MKGKSQIDQDVSVPSNSQSVSGDSDIRANRIFAVLTSLSTCSSDGGSLEDFQSLNIARMGAMSTANWVHPDRSLPNMQWTFGSSGWPLSDDLLPEVLRALGSDVSAKSLRFVELSATGINLLNGMYAIPEGDPRAWGSHERSSYRAHAFGLRITLSDSARERLGTTKTELVLRFRRLIAIAPSSVMVTVAELEVEDIESKPVTVGQLQEVLHVISNRNRSSSCGLASVMNSFGYDLQSMLSSVLPPSSAPTEDRSRLYTYTAAVIQASFADSSALVTNAFRCARRYTAAYELNDVDISSHVLRPFEGVVHVFALEGAASLFTDSTDFLMSQAMSRVHESYIWMVVLACHESARVQHLLSSDSRKHLSDRELIREFLDFRRVYNLPVVSTIEIHNQVFDHLRKSLYIDRMIRKMTADVIEAERWTNIEAQERRAQADDRRKIREDQVDRERNNRRGSRVRYAPLEASVAALLMGALTFLAIDSLTRKLWLLRWHGEPSPRASFWLPFTWAVIAMIFRAWQVWKEATEEPLQETFMDYGAEEHSDSDLAIGVAVTSSHQ